MAGKRIGWYSQKIGLKPFPSIRLLETAGGTPGFRSWGVLRNENETIHREDASAERWPLRIEADHRYGVLG